MTENNRFTTNGYKIYDTYHDGLHWLVNNVEANEIVEIMNNLDLKARERSKALSKLQKENEQLKDKLDFHILMTDDERRKYDNYIKKIKKENEELKQTIETQNFNYENAKGVIHSSEHQIQRLQEENDELKSEIIKIIDRKIKNNDKNPSQEFQVYSAVNRALKDVRENLRDIIEDF